MKPGIRLSRIYVPAIVAHPSRAAVKGRTHVLQLPAEPDVMEWQNRAEQRRTAEQNRIFCLSPRLEGE
tara:strand:+ start:1693 stop:1896 length:204 start_codon:yes stop_codon:yes gene_type:complete